MAKEFSAGGKEVLIKSVVQAMPTYAMSCFRIPVSVCNNIERVCMKFWWGDKEKERKMHWATWKSLCRPKSKGGLGFRNMVAFNQSLLAKQVWRLIRCPNSLAARLIKAKYFPNGDVMHAKVLSNCSFLWRSLTWGRELLREGLMWKVANGEDIRVFKDAWLPNFVGGVVLKRDQVEDESRVAEFLDEEGNWDREKLCEKLLPVEVEEIINLDKASYLDKDVRFWKFDQKDEYSVKSGYLLASKCYDANEWSTTMEDAAWWKYLWGFNLPQRINFFAWRVFKEEIPTEINLCRHHVPGTGLCGWCRKGWGTTAHALMFCEKVRKFWYHFEFWKVLKQWEGWNMEMIGGAMQSTVPRYLFEYWLVGMWQIWKKLCAEKHKQSGCGWRDLQQESIAYIESFKAARKKSALATRVLPAEGSHRWVPPQVGRLRLDVDYAVRDGNDKGGVGAILRDETGKVIFAMAKPVKKANSVLHGEIKAMLFGICQCIEEQKSPIEVFSYSLMAIIAVMEEKEEVSILYEDLFDFFAMVKRLNVSSFNHVRREDNKAEHELASLARRLASTEMWHDTLPEWLFRIVSDDLT